jgi:hypothetical protein
MESLRGIFPQSMPPPKRDFLKENVMKIKQIQRMRRPAKEKSEYTNKFSKPVGGNLMVVRPRLCENANPAHRSSTNLALSSSKAPMTNLRKSLSTLSIHSREFGTQTVDPEADEFFLKDTIIRYPSASTVRSSTGQPPTCSRGHAMEVPEERSSRYKSHFSDRRDEYSEKMERHISNLSEYLDKGSISKRQGSKKPTSILKSSSSLQKLNKNSINESQQRDDRSIRVGSAHRNLKLDSIELYDDEQNGFEEEEALENNKELESSRRKEKGGGDCEVDAKKQQQQKAAAEDPDCPDGHVPLSDDDRLEALKLAKKRKFIFHEIVAVDIKFLILLTGFKDFVDELNRLPMTCETLRVRNRKIEIEKELRSLEINIRVFSRPKVYVKLTE